MATVTKNTQVSFKTNTDLIKDAKEIFSEKNLNMTEVFNEFLSVVVSTKEIPFETEDDRKKQAIISELQKEIDKSFESFQSGNFLTQEEMRDRFGL